MHCHCAGLVLLNPQEKPIRPLRLRLPLQRELLLRVAAAWQWYLGTFHHLCRACLQPRYGPITKTQAALQPLTAATASAGAAAAAAAATATAILLIQVQPTFDIIVSPCNVGRGPAFLAAITCLLNMESVVVYDAASNLSRSLREPRNYNDTAPNLTRSIAIDK